MIGNLLDKIVCDGKETIDTLKKVVPFIVIGVLWLLGAIAKTVQASKKSEQPGPQKKTDIKRQPKDLADFIRVVKEQYAAAKEQATKGVEQPSVMRPVSQTVTRPKSPMFEVTRAAVQPVIEKPVVKEPSPVLESVSLTASELTEIKEEHPAEAVSADGEIEQRPYLRELVRQYASVEDLRRAILHYEILGPSVALRE
jgi:hypothetical protein